MSHSALTGVVVSVAGGKHATDYFGSIVGLSRECKFSGTPYTFDPAKINDVAANIRRRDAALIEDLSVTIIPGPRAISQVVTVTAVWVPSDWGAPVSVDEAAMIDGAVVRTFGGQFGLTSAFDLPLSPICPPILKSRICTVRPVLYVQVECNAITSGPTVSTGDYLTIQTKMHYTTYGGI